MYLWSHQLVLDQCVWWKLLLAFISNNQIGNHISMIWIRFLWVFGLFIKICWCAKRQVFLPVWTKSVYLCVQTQLTFVFTCFSFCSQKLSAFFLAFEVRIANFDLFRMNTIKEQLKAHFNSTNSVGQTWARVQSVLKEQTCPSFIKNHPGPAGMSVWVLIGCGKERVSVTFVFYVAGAPLIFVLPWVSLKYLYENQEYVSF